MANHALTALVPGALWHARQAIAIGPITLDTRMTVVRLDDGALWCHAPIEPMPALVNALAALGPVRYVIAPNNSHHLFFEAFLRAHPGAQGFIGPGLAVRQPALRHYPVLPNASPWGDTLPGYFIDGLPILDETVWFHTPSASLILTDLLFCFGRRRMGLARIVARLLGVYERLAMSRTMKLAVRDRVAFARSIAPLLDLPVRRIILAHDQVVEDDAQARLRKAFTSFRALTG